MLQRLAAPHGCEMNGECGSKNKRVLSIQSHVVHGYVGNKAATFPLQVLGYEVDTINSVQYSNHTGYKSSKGQVLNSQDLEDIITGLRGNNLLHYSHLLTGYCGSKSFLEQVHRLVLELRGNGGVTFVCDPVMGDNGQMYVPSDLLPLYRDRLVPVADILTPNQFEAELLSGMEIKTEEEGLKAIDHLLSCGAKCVIITSMEVEPSVDKLVLLAKNRNGESARVEIPKIPAQFTGTGDLFAALLLAWSHEGLQCACEKSVWTMHAVLRRTLKCALEMSKSAKPSAEQIELRLIQSKRDIENPPPHLPLPNHS